MVPNAQNPGFEEKAGVNAPFQPGFFLETGISIPGKTMLPIKDSLFYLLGSLGIPKPPSLTVSGSPVHTPGTGVPHFGQAPWAVIWYSRMV
jgi:hypothetical protein